MSAHRREMKIVTTVTVTDVDTKKEIFTDDTSVTVYYLNTALGLTCAEMSISEYRDKIFSFLYNLLHWKR